MKRSSCIFIVYYPNVFLVEPSSFLSSILTQPNLSPILLRKRNQSEETSAIYYHNIYAPASISVTYAPPICFTYVSMAGTILVKTNPSLRHYILSLGATH